MFQNSDVRILCLSTKNVTCVESEILKELESINALIMDHNLISNLSWMEKLEENSLSYLDFSFNQIESLSSNTFRGITNLIW